MKDRRFIEETFPIKQISAESAREKSIRHGHISTLHIWWARRPLASSRATSYAALTPAPKDTDVSHGRREFIVDFSKWKNSLNYELIRRAREEILKAHLGRPPMVLDPFAGGGSIPLEALRMGCEVHSLDYNPVAVLIQKCTLEYPQQYGGSSTENGKRVGLRESSGMEPLLEDVKKWGNWVFNELKRATTGYYPTEEDGSVPVGYLWARTLPCQNPSCGVSIPLFRQYWLAKKGNKKIALFPVTGHGEVTFTIVGDGHEPMPPDFRPEKGTVSRAIVSCPVCGSVSGPKALKKLFQQGKSGERLIAVVLHHEKRKGKTYRVAAEEDLHGFRQARNQLGAKEAQLEADWGISPVPDEEIPSTMPGGIHPPAYGMKTWGSLFNARQKLVLITLVQMIRDAHRRMLADGYEEGYARAVVTYLALGVDRISDYNSTLTRWVPQGEFIGSTFARQALPMVWDYFELNPTSRATGDWSSAMGWISRVVDHCQQTAVNPAIVSQSSATDLRYPDDHFDAVFTDPPYYYNVTYADLSDYFYVWLKRTIGHLYPELFSTPLTPKTNEIIEGAFWDSVQYKHKDKSWFEEKLTESFREIHRVLKPNGVATIVYTHKSTSGWEALINSLLRSGFNITGSWPLHTEMKERPMAKGSAALASSIYIIARKIEREPTGFYNDVREELKDYLNHKLQRLWDDGVSGADFFIAAIGSAIEVFGKYENVMDFEGKIVQADKLLLDVREIATNYAVRQILHDGFRGDISELTRLYVLWRWEFGEARVPFDDARKLAQSCGIDLSLEWNRDGFVRKEREFIRVKGPHERTIERLENSQELIDILHLALLLWEEGKMDEMTTVLSDSGYAGETLFRVAQAVSQTLPNESKEKRLLDGFLAGRERVREEVRRKTVQTRLI